MLTSLTEFWMRRFENLVPNQLAPDMRLEEDRLLAPGAPRETEWAPFQQVQETIDKHPAQLAWARTGMRPAR